MSSDLRTFSLLELVPESIADDADVIAICAALDPELQAVSAEIEDAVILPRVADLDSDAVEALAYAFDLYSLDAWEQASTAGKKRLLADILDIRRRAGTVYALRRCFDLLLLTAAVIEWFDDAASPWTYRLTLDATEADTTLAAIRTCPELARRFAPASRSLTAIAVTVPVTSALYGASPITQDGIPITFNGP